MEYSKRVDKENRRRKTEKWEEMMRQEQRENMSTESETQEHAGKNPGSVRLEKMKM